MTRQEVFTCDICYAEFKSPLNGEVHMVLIYNGKTQFDGDLCPDCHENIIQLIEGHGKREVRDVDKKPE